MPLPARLRRLAALVATLVAAGVSGPPARGDAAGELAVRSAVVRAEGRSGRHAARVTVAVLPDDALRAFDLGTDHARLALGPVALLADPASDAEARVVRRRAWAFACSIRREGVRVRATLNVASGVLRVATRGLDLAPLVGAGPTAVPVRLELGGRAYEGAIDFRVRRHRWTHRGPRFPAVPPDPASQFVTLLSGDQPPVQTVGVQVFGSDAELAAFWQQVPGAGPVPAVDFGTHVVAGVFVGARGDLYSVAVTAFAVQGADMTLTAQESRPGPTCPAALLTYVPRPFTLVRVPRVDGTIGVTYLPVRLRNCP